ncbi:hypothetical protein HAX54_039891, partial [Datura stramonium]|nr:hypothetical protein [Datura stramonium]
MIRNHDLYGGTTSHGKHPWYPMQGRVQAKPRHHESWYNLWYERKTHPENSLEEFSRCSSHPMMMNSDHDSW